jgi:hypothetical protein
MQIGSMNPYCTTCTVSRGSQQETKEQSIQPDLSLNARFIAHEFQTSEVTGSNAGVQSALFDMANNNKDMMDFLKGIESEGAFSLKDLGYEGKSLLELNTSEATALVSDGGFFSVDNTAQRAADFVVGGAGGDLDMLKAGREGIVKGFEQAEKLWGGKLPDIAYDTQKLTLEKIDQTIQELGGNVLDLAA